MQRLTSRVFAQAPSPHGDWNVKRGIRVAPSRPDWSVDVSVLRRLCVSPVHARRLIDLTVLVVVIPIEDWTRGLFRDSFFREQVHFVYRFFFFIIGGQAFLFVFLLKFSRTLGFHRPCRETRSFQVFSPRYIYGRVPSHVYIVWIKVLLTDLRI